MFGEGIPGAELGSLRPPRRPSHFTRSFRRRRHGCRRGPLLPRDTQDYLTQPVEVLPPSLLDSLDSLILENGGRLPPRVQQDLHHSFPRVVIPPRNIMHRSRNRHGYNSVASGREPRGNDNGYRMASPQNVEAQQDIVDEIPPDIYLGDNVDYAIAQTAQRIFGRRRRNITNRTPSIREGPNLSSPHLSRNPDVRQMGTPFPSPSPYPNGRGLLRHQIEAFTVRSVRSVVTTHENGESGLESAAQTRFSSTASVCMGNSGTLVNRNVASTDSDGEPIQCAICMESYETGEPKRTLPCFHTYHVVCVDTWLRSSRQCPICQSVVTDRSTLRWNNQIRRQDAERRRLARPPRVYPLFM